MVEIWSETKPDLLMGLFCNGSGTIASGLDLCYRLGYVAGGSGSALLWIWVCTVVDLGLLYCGSDVLYCGSSMLYCYKPELVWVVVV